MKLVRWARKTADGALLAGVVLLAGCDDDGSLRSQYAITAEEAAVIIADAFASDTFTYGLTGQLEDLTGIARNAAAGSADTVTFSRTRAGVNSYLYELHVEYGFSGDELDRRCGAKGAYATAAVTSQDTAYTALRFLGTGEDALMASGYAWRLGREVSRVEPENTFAEDIVATFDDLHIAKNTQKILSGTVTFTMRERLPDGVVVSFPGSWTYFADRRAALEVSGRVYRVEVDTGAMTAEGG